MGGGGGERGGGSPSKFYLIFLKYPIKVKLFGLTEAKLCYFHRIFKTGDEEVGSSEPLEPPLDSPLALVRMQQSQMSSPIISATCSRQNFLLPKPSQAPAQALACWLIFYYFFYFRLKINFLYIILSGIQQECQTVCIQVWV